MTAPMSSVSTVGGVAPPTPHPPQENSYIIRPNFQNKFKAPRVKDSIRHVLKEELSGKVYDPEEVPGLTKRIAETIKDEVKEMDFDRYKVVVQVVLGEQRGEGVKMVARCFWDADTDNFAQEVYMNESLFCVAAAFGIYYY
ncbi:tctex1 domain-containing protein 2 [Callorhinchus milii]|uniref:Tctex1 domain-containing protein 2-like protein n=1 Tax=Callorhinchus milii TaxID=7868 RepID=K4FTH6_CALMI|nr:tctex1 domain-containing protein 2 [Callorhinchus milii]AFK11085.1 tctex1 domain-containing protein 2-like protein [Callorhinchus milii]|eukprot:gi/632985015/ref/XP_007909444.1/ PREDICTED: tctex1 domain-containing protein 2 [Callorhinchus milii]